MNERVAKLRKVSVETRPYISTERAELVTAFYRDNKNKNLPTPLARAFVFKYLLANKTVCINDGELIVGERGPAPKATPTYPEQCCHSLEDLAILNRRKKTPFAVTDEVKQIYEKKIIPFWAGSSMRDKVFASMSEQWHKAFRAGVFTEFMEQRSPGHAVLDDKIYTRGMLDFKKDIQKSLEKIDFKKDPAAEQKKNELEAMAICADAIIQFAQRYSKKASVLAAKETDAVRRVELERIAEICKHVPANPPRNFYEALQCYWFIHLGVISEMNLWDSFNPGRVDQNLYPFYKSEIENGTLTPEGAKELLGCLWVKFNNHPAPPKVGITEEQSSTYVDFPLINTGGVKPEDGSDAVNDLSYLLLDVIEDMRLPQPGSCIQLSKKNPDRFLHRACQVIRTGFGQPSVFNTDIIIQEMLRSGKSLKDARRGGPIGCVETVAFGREKSTLTGYFNLPKIIELVCNNGFDPITGEQIGPKTGDVRKFTCFEQFVDAYRKQLNCFMDMKIEGNNTIEQFYANLLPAPFLSILIDDCIAGGLDYHRGGARYNTAYVQGVGIGTTADSLAAIKLHIYEKKDITWKELLEAMKNNFDGAEPLRQILVNRTPNYGNDDDYADLLAQEVFNIYFDSLDGRPNTIGGHYHINLLPTTSHIYFGSVLGAMPNGRRAQIPISEGISPSQGVDTKGPTAVLKSASKIDHARTGGTLLNMKFSPASLAGENLNYLVGLIRSYFKLDGHHIQFNVIDAKILREAQKNPEQYRDLIVRVAGYSDYFIDLAKDLQDEIISRTEQSIRSPGRE
jgi:trans-4-hydroxy-L-proline dehydratase